MNSKLVNLTYEVQLQSGETLALPDTLTKNIGAGRWLITIQPVQPIPNVAPRSHDAFLTDTHLKTTDFTTIIQPGKLIVHSFVFLTPQIKTLSKF